MLDLGSLPSLAKCDVQVFTGYAVTASLEWQTWRFPRGASMLAAFCVGGGAGGGGGFTRIAGAAGGGGGGGGSAGTCRLLVPAYYLPETLYISVGVGGRGVASGGGTAGGGVQSWIAVKPDLAQANNVLCQSAANSPAGGTTGTGAASGTGGAGGNIAVIGNMAMAGLGIFQAIAGQSGAAGGAQTGAIGTATTIPTTSVRTQGGAGGAGTTSADFAGGACTAIAGDWLSEQRPATPAAGSFNGSSGPLIWEPFFSFGGLGGSASNAGVGGQGGPGAYGSGGGGGGAGTTGGRGGDGGQGIVIMIAW